MFHATGLTPRPGADAASGSPTSSPTTLAIMHGSSFTGDGAAQLRALADGYTELAGASLPVNFAHWLRSLATG